MFQALKRRKPMSEFESVFALQNKGLEACVHGRANSPRQVLLIDIETLEEFGLLPGRVKENITTRGLDLAALPGGGWIQAGEAILKFTVPCEPCSQMDEIQPGLQEALRGRRGILCRVVRSGKIRRGDSVEFVKNEEMRTNPQAQAERRATTVQGAIE